MNGSCLVPSKVRLCTEHIFRTTKYIHINNLINNSKYKLHEPKVVPPLNIHKMLSAGKY